MSLYAWHPAALIGLVLMALAAFVAFFWFLLALPIYVEQRIRWLVEQGELPDDVLEIFAVSPYIGLNLDILIDGHLRRCPDPALRRMRLGLAIGYGAVIAGFITVIAIDAIRS